MAYQNLSLTDQILHSLFNVRPAEMVIERCAGESSESSYGAGDAQPCNRIATVAEIESGFHYCATCFKAVL